MRILALDTSTQRGSVALFENGHVVAEGEHDQPNSNAELLLPLIQRLLREASWDLASLDRLAVGVGPGSFTGLRVGIALAQGIALGAARPLVGVGSLRAMALGASDAVGLRCPVLDARRNEVFAAVYDEAGRERLAPCAVPKAAFADWAHQLAAAEPLTLVGDAGLCCDASLPRSSAPSSPAARFIAELASREQEPASRYAVLAHYVRPPDLVAPNLPPSPFLSA